MYPYFDEADCVYLSSKQIICPGDPIRIDGTQGLWRYIKPISNFSFEAIGPYFPNNPSRNGGRSRIFNMDKAKYPGRKAKRIDVTDFNITAISEEAKRHKRA